MLNKLAAVGIALIFVGCDSGTGSDSGSVSLLFGATPSSQTSATIHNANDDGRSDDKLILTGTNGSLVIEDIRFIVSEAGLKSPDRTLCGRDNDDAEGNLEIRGDHSETLGDTETTRPDDDCEFEGGPFIVDLPLGGNTSVTTERIPAGRYNSLEFEIDDLHIDEDDDDVERARTPAVITQMRSVFPKFPNGASMVVKGRQNGKPFVVYFKSDMEIESRLNLPVDGKGNEALTVKIDPERWFKSGDRVMNLLALDGRLVELGSDFTDGLRGAGSADEE